MTSRKMCQVANRDIKISYYPPVNLGDALKLAKEIGELNVLSQNLMHSNISITDGIYGMLSNEINKKFDELLTLLKQNTPINSE